MALGRPDHPNSTPTGDGADLGRLVEAMPIALVAVDSAGRLALVNDQAARLFGYGREELLGRPVEALVPERCRDGHGSLRDAFSGEPVVRPMGAGRELFGLRKDGREIPLEIGLNPVDVPDGRYVLASIIDLTERRRAHEFEQTMVAVVDSADDAIITKSLDGTIRSWNPAAERLLGYSAEEMVGQPVTRLIPDDRLDEETEIVARIVRGERVAHLETVRRTKAGLPLNVSLTISPIRDRSGAIAGASKIMRDITDRKRAEELRLANAGMLAHTVELEALNAELESFSYSISHDLRAPVRAMLGFSGALLDDYGERLDDEGRRLLTVVHDEAARMGALIDDLLEFSRFGRAPLQRAAVEMDELVRDVVAEQRQLAGDARAAIAVAPLPRVVGDRTLLRQVWANLISNALKYSSRNERPAISIAGTVDGNVASFSIRDNGVGFDMRYAGKLFGVFQRLHRDDEFSGTGVGLAIVQRIVQRHGGSVRAEAVLGKGATFTLSLPAAGLP